MRPLKLPVLEAFFRFINAGIDKSVLSGKRGIGFKSGRTGVCAFLKSDGLSELI